MSKLHLSQLEAIALRNRLDLEFTINKQGLATINDARYDMIHRLMERYEEITGNKYVFLGYERREE